MNDQTIVYQLILASASPRRQQSLGSTLLGKPAHAQEATEMLVALRAQIHEVHTGVSVFATDSHQQRTLVNTTRVRMRNYSDAAIAAYVATGDPLDKAGAYAIQHREFDPAAELDGCLSGVMGLPLGDLRDLLATFAITLPRPVALACTRHGDFGCCQA
ncbi:MAG: Maf family protein [Chloroflexi bacterium]|nr:Maf family protein [Chloroflexota bacterium]